MLIPLSFSVAFLRVGGGVGGRSSCFHAAGPPISVTPQASLLSAPFLCCLKPYPHHHPNFCCSAESACGEKERWRSLDRCVPSISSWQCLAISHSAHLGCGVSEAQFAFHLVIILRYDTHLTYAWKVRLLTRHRGTGLRA